MTDLLENLRLLQQAHIEVASNLDELRRSLASAALNGDRAGLIHLGEAAGRVVERLTR